MIQRLLFFLFILLSFSVYSQTQGPPPPCGLILRYACDDNEDGFAVFNLDELLPFESFCRVDKGVAEDYYPIVYYLTQEERNNETNPIANPEAYINISNPQNIFYRANKIVPNQFITYLAADAIIEATWLIPFESVVTVYDNNSDGFLNFDLTSVDVFCNSNDKNNYSVSYHLSYLGAESGDNPIANPSAFQNTTNPQYINIRAVHNSTGNVETTNFVLKVLFAEAHIPSDLLLCDDIVNDGFTTIDLTYKNAEVLGSQNPNDFTVTYYVTRVDAESKSNPIINLDSYQNVANPQTIYARVEELTKGSFALSLFEIKVVIPPLLTQPIAYEICDDDSMDGVEVFDLSSKDAELLTNFDGIGFWNLSYHESLIDAENNLNSISTSYTNTSISQTIYARIEDSVDGCFSITSFDLIVQDCTTKGVIEINAFYDADGSASFENDEINFLNGTLTYEKNNNGIQHILYSSNGVFTIISDDENNIYDVSYEVLTEYNTCYDITTTSYNGISVANGSAVNYNFPITKVQDCGDIAVYLVSYASPRPGFDYYTRLIIKNKGLETVSSGTVEFVHDPLITFNSVTNISAGNTVTNTATGFTLDFVNLKPNEQQTVIVNMNVPVPTSLGALLTNTATYSIVDLSIENNTSILSETVIGSYDPNDIAESHGPDILYSNFETTDYLYYTVRFQNVGTADAINVSIDNTLDARLDESTIVMLNSSHTNVFTRVNDQLNWKFDDIHLPSEDMDEPNSHGYVYYKIKPLAGYKVGDIIPNTAEIYFDFNPAVITNTFNTEFITTLSNTEFNNNEFSIYPNPANDFVAFKFNKSTSNLVDIEVYDIQGKQIINIEKALKSTSLKLDVSGLSKGMYFVKLDDGNLRIIKKLLVN